MPERQRAWNVLESKEDQTSPSCPMAGGVGFNLFRSPVEAIAYVSTTRPRRQLSPSSFHQPQFYSTSLEVRQYAAVSSPDRRLQV